MYPAVIRGARRLPIGTVEEEMLIFLSMPPGTRVAFDLDGHAAWYLDPSIHGDVEWVSGTSPKWRVLERL